MIATGGRLRRSMSTTENNERRTIAADSTLIPAEPLTKKPGRVSTALTISAPLPRPPYAVCEALVCSRRWRVMMLGSPGSIPTSAKMGMRVAPKTSNDSGDSQIW